MRWSSFKLAIKKKVVVGISVFALASMAIFAFQNFYTYESSRRAHSNFIPFAFHQGAWSILKMTVPGGAYFPLWGVGGAPVIKVFFSDEDGKFDFDAPAEILDVTGPDFLDKTEYSYGVAAGAFSDIFVWSNFEMDVQLVQIDHTGAVRESVPAEKSRLITPPAPATETLQVCNRTVTFNGAEINKSHAITIAKGSGTLTFQVQSTNCTWSASFEDGTWLTGSNMSGPIGSTANVTITSTALTSGSRSSKLFINDYTVTITQNSQLVSAPGYQTGCGSLSNGQSSTVVDGTVSVPQNCPIGGTSTKFYERLVTSTCTNGVLSTSTSQGNYLSQSGSCNPSTIQLLVNGGTSKTINPGAAANYTWTSAGVTNVSSTYSTSGTYCGQPASGAWLVNTTSGSRSDTVQACQAGKTFTLTISGQGFEGTTRTSSVTVVVPAANVTLSLNKTSYNTGEAPIYTVSGSPNSPIYWTSTKNGASTGESNSHYGQLTNSSGTWTGSGAAWTSANGGNWTKTATVAGKSNTKSFTVVTGPTLALNGTNYRGIINGRSHLELYGTFGTTGNTVSMSCNAGVSVTVDYQSTTQINISWNPLSSFQNCFLWITGLGQSISGQFIGSVK